MRPPRTRCRVGHRLTPDNVYSPPGRPNTRICRKCRTITERSRGRQGLRKNRGCGRGRNWAQKLITQRQARRIARYRAGLIIESVITAGWEAPDLVKRYGEDGFQQIAQELEYYAAWLSATGHPDGSGS